MADKWAVNRHGIPPLTENYGFVCLDWMKNKTYKALVEKEGYQYDKI